MAHPTLTKTLWSILHLDPAVANPDGIEARLVTRSAPVDILTGPWNSQVREDDVGQGWPFFDLR